MISRRSFIKATLATSVVTAMGCTQRAGQSLMSSVGALHKNTWTDTGEMRLNKAGSGIAQSVNCFIGTGGHGHTYPGATVPFGMVQLSPDTSNRGWDSCSGYHQQDGSIMGFSHTHLSGTGCADMLDVLVVPASGKVKLQPGSLDDPDEGYRSRYDRDSEFAYPGYYSVFLTDSKVRAELSATQRAGIHRYTFEEGQPAELLIDLLHGQQDWWTDQNVTRVKNAHVKRIGNDTIVGGRQVFQWAYGRWVYFAMKLSRPFSDVTLYSDDNAVSGTDVKGTNLKCILHFDDGGSEPLLVKVGLSAVDTDGALANLDADIPDFDFDSVVAAAGNAWEQELSKVRVKTTNATHKIIFNTSHYHSLLAPTLFSDVDGRYRGMDNEIHQLKTGEENYSTYSLWDTYRTLHPFFTLTQSQRLPAMLQGLVRMGQQSPAGAPIWPLQGRETDTMIGYHSASVLAEAYIKKVPGVDYAGAYNTFIKKRAFVDDVHGFGLYREKHYIPADKVNEAVSRTLEFAYSDWAASKLALAAGVSDEAAQLKNRSQYYRNVFDKSVGFVRGKRDDGSWVTPFSPDSLGHDQSRWRDFTETNSWQATFLNQHDIYNYMTLFGGPQAFEDKLDALFSASSDMTDGHLSDISGLVGQYAHGNEPSHHVAYLYAYCGAHYKTQHRVHMLREAMYQNAFDGLSGNEDCGQMSAWLVMSAIGFYPVDPASGVYVLGTPMFEQLTMDVGNGNTLLVDTENFSYDKPYIKAVYWNDKPYSKTYLQHSDVVKGGVLKFVMSDKPNKTFGHEMEDRPPSFQ